MSPPLLQDNLFHEIAIQEGNHLCAGASGIGAELVVAGAIGNAVLDSPLDRLCIVRISGDISKGDDAAHRLAVCHAADESDHLCAGAGHIGTKGGSRSAFGDAILHRHSDRGSYRW